MENIRTTEELLSNGHPVIFNRASPQASREVAGSVIESALRSGKAVHLEGAVVRETINLVGLAFSGLELDGCELEGVDARNCRASQGISISGSRIAGKFVLDGGSLDGPLSMDRSVFEGGVSCRGARFAKNVSMRRVVCNSSITFSTSALVADVDLSKLQVRQLFLSSTTIGGRLLALGLRVSGAAFFNWARIEGVAYLSFSRFGKIAAFDGAVFNEDLHCVQMTVVGEAGLTSVSVGGTADFSGARFASSLIFDGTTVVGDLALNDASVLGRASFIGATIKGQVQFEGVVLDDRENQPKFDSMTAEGGFFGSNGVYRAGCSFILARIGKDFEVSGSRFEKEAAFNRISVAGDFFSSPTELSDQNKGSPQPTEYYGDVLFVGATIAGQLNLTDAQFKPQEGERTKLNLRGANIGTLRIVEDIVLSKRPEEAQNQFTTTSVDLRGCTYSQLYGYFDDLLSAQSDFDDQPYAFMESYLRRIGRNDFANDVYYLAQLTKGQLLSERVAGRPFWDQVRNSIDVAKDRIWRITVGYGVRPALLYFLVVAAPITAWIFFSQPNAACVSVPGKCVLTQLDPYQSAWLSARVYLPIEISALKDIEPAPQVVLFHGFGLIRSDYFASLLKISGWILIPIALATFVGLLRRGQPASQD